MTGAQDGSTDAADRSILGLYTLYPYQYKGSSKTAIPVAISAFLTGLYIAYINVALIWVIEGSCTWVFYHETLLSLTELQAAGPNPSLEQSPIWDWWFVWGLPLLGFTGIGFDEVENRIDKVIKYIRVSSESQQDKYGKDRQRGPLEKEVKKLDPEESITIADDWESARTMLRGNIENILETVSADDESTYCLMLEDVDRLSRADPFEACMFFWLLNENDVIIYFANLGYFDLSEPGQQLSIFFGLYQSRKEYNKIAERTSAGQREVKENGGLPGPAPFGYEKEDDSHVIEICEEEAEIIETGVNNLLNAGGPISAVWRELNEEYGERCPTYSTFLNILRREMYTGEIRHEGEVVSECPTIIPRETLQQIQEILDDQTKETVEDEELDPVLKTVIERFGIEPSIELLDVIKGKCPDCGGDVKTWGSTERWGHRVRRYQCKEEGCTFQGPLLSEDVLQQWEGTLPLTCPICQTPADDDEWRQSKTKINAIEQTCNSCSHEYSVDLTEESTNKLRRGLELPDCAISLFEDDDEEDGQSTSSKISQGDSEDKSDDRDDHGQTDLASFD
jgi:DNA invertase Pin-like site-specific DNA recombinase